MCSHRSSIVNRRWALSLAMCACPRRWPVGCAKHAPEGPTDSGPHRSRRRACSRRIEEEPLVSSPVAEAPVASAAARFTTQPARARPPPEPEKPTPRRRLAVSVEAPACAERGVRALDPEAEKRINRVAQREGRPSRVDTRGLTMRGRGYDSAKGFTEEAEKAQAPQLLRADGR
jgi:hypothetical protein